MELSLGLYDDNNDPVTGVATDTLIKFRRVSDGFFLDWDDLNYKGSGWVDITTILVEIDATNHAGYYKKDVDESGWTDSWYQAFLSYTGSPKIIKEYTFYVKSGKIVEVYSGDNLDVVISSRSSSSELSTHDSKLDVVAGYIDTEIIDIKNKTDNLPSDPASETNVDANETKIDSLLATCTEGRLSELDVANLPSDIDGIKAKTDNLPPGIPKNTALNNFPFLMVLTSDHVTGAVGLTITAERSIDGGAFGACTNSPVEISNGMYKINLSAADLNGDVITLKFSEAAADDRIITIKTTL